MIDLNEPYEKFPNYIYVGMSRTHKLNNLFLKGKFKQ